MIQRSGSALVVVLVALAVCTSILLTLTSSSLRSRRQLRTELQVEQTHWLLDAGIRRAYQQLGSDAAYEGESFRIMLDELDDGIAQVDITIANEHSDRKAIEVKVQIGDDDEPGVVTRKSKRLSVKMDELSR